MHAKRCVKSIEGSLKRVLGKHPHARKGPYLASDSDPCELKSCYVPCHVHARCRRTCSYERNRERAVRIQPLLSARRKYRGWMHHKTHAHSHTSLLAADDVQASGFYPFPVGGRGTLAPRRQTMPLHTHGLHIQKRCRPGPSLRAGPHTANLQIL